MDPKEKDQGVAAGGVAATTAGKPAVMVYICGGEHFQLSKVVRSYNFL